MTDAEPQPFVWHDMNDDGPPPLNLTCLVYGQEAWEKTPSIKLDVWQELSEQPLSFSSATIYIGDGWGECDSVTHWMLLKEPSK